MPEPEVIKGHPALLLDPWPGDPKPHWRPWGISWKTPKAKPVVIHLCANCERLRTVLWLSNDRWLCTACRNEGNEKPTYVPVNRKRAS